MKTVDTKKLRADAADANAKGNLKRALALYEELCVRDPADPQGPHRTGELLRRFGRNAEAIERFSAAADLYAKQGFLLKSVAVCKIILQLDPRHTVTQTKLASLYARHRAQDVKPAQGRQETLPASGQRFVQLPGLILDENGVARSALDVRDGLDEKPSAPPPAPPTNRKATQPPAPEASGLRPPALPETNRKATQPPAPEASGLRPPALPEASGLRPPALPETNRKATQPPPGQTPYDAWNRRSAAEVRGSLPRDPLGGAARALAAPAPPVVPADAPPVAPARHIPPEPLSVRDAPSAARVLPDEEAGGLHDALELVIEDYDEDEEDTFVGTQNSQRPLPATPLFTPLTEETLRDLIEKIDYKTYAPGEAIARQGAIGDSLYVIAEGEVRVVHEGPPEIEISRLGEGDFFGEIAVVSAFPRTATVLAVRETEVLRLSRTVVLELVAKHPEFFSVLLRFVRDRLLQMVKAASPMFLTLPVGDRDSLASRFKFLEVEANRILVREAERSQALFILLAGRLEVSTTHENGRRVLGELASGSIIGEVSLLTRHPAEATVRTVSRCWFLFMERHSFQEVLVTYPMVLEYVNELAEQRKQAIERFQLV